MNYNYYICKNTIDFASTILGLVKISFSHLYHKLSSYHYRATHSFRTAVHKASQEDFSGDLSKIEKLIENKGVNLDCEIEKDGETALMLALGYEKYDLANKLLEYGAKANTPWKVVRGNLTNEFQTYCSAKHPDYTKEDRNYPWNNQDKKTENPLGLILTTLFLEIENSKIKKIEIDDCKIIKLNQIFENLLKHGANPNIYCQHPKSMRDWPLIVIAARYGYTQLLSLLIKYGAYINIFNGKGRLLALSPWDSWNPYVIPLACAVKASNLEAIKKLCEAGSPIDNIFYSSPGHNIFHFIVQNKHPIKYIETIIIHARFDKNIKTCINAKYAVSSDINQKEIQFQNLEQQIITLLCVFNAKNLPRDVQLLILAKLDTDYFAHPKLRRLLLQRGFIHPLITPQVKEHINKLCKLQEEYPYYIEKLEKEYPKKEYKKYMESVKPYLNGSRLKSDLKEFETFDPRELNPKNLALRIYEKIHFSIPAHSEQINS